MNRQKVTAFDLKDPYKYFGNVTVNTRHLKASNDCIVYSDNSTYAISRPISKNNSKIFYNKSFLLCYVRPPAKSEIESESSISGLQESELYDLEYSFNHMYLREIITAGGGKIYDNFESIPFSDYPNTRLVTNRPNLSAKFLLCLTHGIEAILHIHIIKACNGMNIGASRISHAGWSLIESRWIDRIDSDIPQIFEGKQIFVGLREYINNEENNIFYRFRKFWGAILERRGAKIIRREDEEFIELFVIDKSMANQFKSIYTDLELKNMPVMSTSWVTQSLIHGRLLPYDSHDSFCPL